MSVRETKIMFSLAKSLPTERNIAHQSWNFVAASSVRFISLPGSAKLAQKDKRITTIVTCILMYAVTVTE